MFPSKLSILGKNYKIVICDTQAQVDVDGKEELSGQIDFATRTIRIHKTNMEDMWHTLFHELLHALGEDLHLKINDEENHNELDVLALFIFHTLVKNNLLKGYKQHE